MYDAGHICFIFLFCGRLYLTIYLSELIAVSRSRPANGILQPFLDPVTYADAVVQVYLDNAGDLVLIQLNEHNYIFFNYLDNHFL